MKGEAVPRHTPGYRNPGWAAAGCHTLGWAAAVHALGWVEEAVPADPRVGCLEAVQCLEAVHCLEAVQCLEAVGPLERGPRGWL